MGGSLSSPGGYTAAAAVSGRSYVPPVDAHMSAVPQNQNLLGSARQVPIATAARAERRRSGGAVQVPLSKTAAAMTQMPGRRMQVMAFSPVRARVPTAALPARGGES